MLLDSKITVKLVLRSLVLRLFILCKYKVRYFKVRLVTNVLLPDSAPAIV